MVYHSIKLLKFKVLLVLEGRKLSVNERWQLLGNNGQNSKRRNYLERFEIKKLSCDYDKMRK